MDPLDYQFREDNNYEEIPNTFHNFPTFFVLKTVTFFSF